MKRALRGAAIVLTAVGAVACVQQAWQVHYSVGGNNYTFSETLAIGAGGHVFTVGTTQNDATPGVSDGVFVAAFDATGIPLWDQLIPGESGNMTILASGSVLAVDQQNNVYVGWGNLALDQVQIYKFDAQGTFVNSWLAPSSELAWVDDMKVGPDQNLYVSAGAGSFVGAYTLQGELLWQAPTPPTTVVERDLDQYPGIVPASNPFAMGGTFDFMADGKILYAARNGLALFNGDGTVHAKRTVTDLQLSAFARAVNLDGQIVLLGVTEYQAELVRLDSDLNELGRIVVDELQDDIPLLARSGNSLCVVTGPNYLENTAGNYRVSQFNSLGEQLASTEMPVAPGNYWFVDDVAGNGAGCDVSEVFADQDGNVTSRITSFSLAGKPRDIIEIPDYIVGQFVGAGKDIVQVGIAGEYDNSFTEVLLTKHRRY